MKTVARSSILVVLSVCALGASAAPSHAGPGLVFESRAPGTAGGGQGISPTIFPGHTFRLTEPAEVTALGALLDIDAGESVFGAIYDLGPPTQVPDVAGDSNLIDVALIEAASSGTIEVTGPLSLTLDAGWYAFVLGTGRHGANAGQFDVSLPNTGTASSSQVWQLPYTMNATTNARTFSSSTPRAFIEGQFITPEPPDASLFCYDTATDWVRLSAQSMFIDSNTFWGTRFEVTETTTVDEAGVWLTSGSGEIFAAILEIDSPTADPLPPSHPLFDDSVAASTLITVASGTGEYTGDLAGAELEPGHYALVFGSGLFGADGEALIPSLSDPDYVTNPGCIVWSGAFWSEFPDTTYRMFVKGSVAACEGDADGNGSVNSNDIGYIVFRLGNTGTPGEVDGDVNADGTVDSADIGYVIFRLGNTCD